MAGLEERISSHSLEYIPSPGEVVHLQGDEGEEEEGKFALMAGLDIDCRFGVFGDGPLVLSDLREILLGNSVRCRGEWEVVWE